ncbi:MAG: protein kinase [Planctomycetota bacterium]
MPNQTDHPTNDELSAFALGDLPPEAAEQVEKHVSSCDSCCETIVGLAEDDTFVCMLRKAQVEATQAGETADAHGSNETPLPLQSHPRYEVQRLVGRGGMGRVYAARHRVMQRTVALKVIHREWVTRQEAIDRFQREMTTAASLDHPNIVTAFDAEQADDLHFLVMEYVDGVDLAQTVRQNGPLPIGQACEFIRQAAEGLQHAHEKGMVHRDIKPHNLIVTSNNDIKILDFGLASLTPQLASADPIDEDADGGLTIAGAIMGTPDFISPEQAVDARNVDGRSDIYSLGMTLYFLLAGQVPFGKGSAADKLRQHKQDEPTSLSTLRDDIPDDLQRVITQMTVKDPDKRLQSASDVVEALQPFTKRLEQASPAREHFRIKYLGGAAFIAGLALVLGMLFQWHSPRRDRNKLDAFLTNGESKEPAGDIVTRLLRSNAGRNYLRELDESYSKLAYSEGKFADGYSSIVVFAFEDSVAGVSTSQLQVRGRSATGEITTSHPMQQGLRIASVGFDESSEARLIDLEYRTPVGESVLNLRPRSTYAAQVALADLFELQEERPLTLDGSVFLEETPREPLGAPTLLSVGKSGLAGNTLSFIRQPSVTWRFTDREVTLSAGGMSIPRNFTDEIFAGKTDCHSIVASWRLINRGRVLQLFDLRVDGKPSAHEAKLRISLAGHIRINIGNHQYNRRKTKADQAIATIPESIDTVAQMRGAHSHEVAQLTEAICRAAGVPNDEWLAFAKSHTAFESIQGEPLSISMPNELLRSSENEIPKPKTLHGAMTLSSSRGYHSLLQPEYITDITYDVEATNKSSAKLTGRVHFNALGLYRGAVNFVAEATPAVDGFAIQVTEFSVPSLGFRNRLNKDGLWVKSHTEPFSGDTFADDYDFSYVPGEAAEVYGYSPRRLAKDKLYGRVLDLLTDTPVAAALTFDRRLEQVLWVKLPTDADRQSGVVVVATVAEESSRDFIRWTSRISGSHKAWYDLPLEELHKVGPIPFSQQRSCLILDEKTFLYGEPLHLESFRELLPKPRDAEFLAATTRLNKNEHQVFAVAKSLDSNLLPQLAAATGSNPDVDFLMQHRPIVTDSEYLSLALSLGDQPQLEVISRMSGSNKQAAVTESLNGLISSMAKLAESRPTNPQRFDDRGVLQLTPIAKSVLTSAIEDAGVTEPSEIESRLKIMLTGVIPELRPYIAETLNRFGSREELHDAQSKNQLLQLGLAFHNFAAAYGHFPSVKTKIPNAKYRVSWRVAILPFIGENQLYDEYNKDEPWDSEHNLKLLNRMPRLYRHTSQKTETGKTNYVAIAGTGTATGDGTKAIKLEDITDVFSETILVAESLATIPWTCPEDPVFDPSKPLPTLGGIHAKGFQAAMADGSVQVIPADISDAKRRAMYTRSSGD